MSGRGFPCWQCGRPAPGGVCLGPHPDYSHGAARSAGMVMSLDGIGKAMTFTGSAYDEQAYKRRYWREIAKPRQAQYRLDRKVRVQLAIAARIERMNAA